MNRDSVLHGSPMAVSAAEQGLKGCAEQSSGLGSSSSIIPESGIFSLWPRFVSFPELLVRDEPRGNQVDRRLRIIVERGLVMRILVAIRLIVGQGKVLFLFSMSYYLKSSFVVLSSTFRYNPKA